MEFWKCEFHLAFLPLASSFLVASLTTSRCYILRHFLLVNYLTLSLQVFENFILITWLLVCFHFYFEFLEATELVSLVSLKMIMFEVSMYL